MRRDFSELTVPSSVLEMNCSSQNAAVQEQTHTGMTHRNIGLFSSTAVIRH